MSTDEKSLKPTQSTLDLYEDLLEETESKTGEDFIDVMTFF
jgi:hypothetical protein